MRFTFRRTERLKSRKTIGQLFKAGQSHGAYPLRLIWFETAPPKEGEGTPVQFAVSVPKRNFKSAVTRNRLKRRVREAWRLNKPWLYRHLSDTGKHFAFMVLYVGKEEFEFEKIEHSLRKLNRIFLKKTFSGKTKTAANRENN